MPSAHLEVEELAAMHREAHEGTSKRPRRKNTVEIEDTKYEALVSAKSEAETKVTDLTAKLEEIGRKIETLEAEKVAAEEQRAEEKKRADAAEEAQRVAAMKDERMSALGTGFRAKLDKLETTAKRVAEQAAKLDDTEWEARLVELEETLSVKRDAKLDEKSGDGDEGKGGEGESTAGLLFDRETVAKSAVGAGGGSEEITAGAGEGDAPTPERRQSVMGGLIRPRKQDTAKA